MKPFRKLCSIFIAFVTMIGAGVFSTSFIKQDNQNLDNSSLSQTKSGGGGATPSPDKIDNVYPQPEFEFNDQDYVVKSPYTLFNKNAVYNVITNSDPAYRSEVPQEYTQIEYLESNGSQYIDTGVGNVHGLKVQGTIMYLANSGILCGYLVSGYVNNTLISINSGKFSILTGGNEKISNISVLVGQKQTIESSTIIGDEYIKVGDDVFQPVGYAGQRTNASVYLFSSNNVKRYASARIYDFKIYSDDVLVRDYVPVISPGDEFGLYDVVNDAFYKNNGTGGFNTPGYSLSGSGTESDPYQIGCIEDLLFYQRYQANTKYCVVTDDIVFNDGYFTPNDDGTCTYHDGGDRVLYDWGKNSFQFKQIDGQNHLFKNFYSSDSGLISLVFVSSVQYIKNINMIGGYINTSKITGFICCDQSSDIKIINCEVDGYLYKTGSTGSNQVGSGLIVGCGAYSASTENCIAKGRIASMSDFVSGIGGTTFKNCVNYAEVKGSRAGGMVGNIWGSATCTNCKNYGKITGRSYAGGIAGATVGGTFKNCYNYGEVTSTNSGGKTAGILADSVNIGGCSFYNCGNEGDVSAISDSGYNLAAGISIATNQTAKIIQNCYNKGNISVLAGNAPRTYGLTFGAQVAVDCVNYGDLRSGESWSCFNTVSKSITNCKNYGKANGFVGTLENNAVMIGCMNGYKGKMTTGLVQTCSGKIYRSVNESNAKYGLVETLNGTGAIYECESFGDSTYYISNKINSGGEVKNCHFKGESQRAVGTNNGTLTNIVYESSSKKEYYGTDFSKFFLTWKDRKIGLIAIESVGLYRGKLTEKYLFDNDFNAVDHIYEVTEEEKENKFKSTYTQLEYLESTGTQYIDTGVLSGLNIGIEIDFIPCSNGSIFGVTPSSATQYYGINLHSGGQCEIYWGSGGNYPKVSNWQQNTRYTLEFNKNADKKVRLNNSEIYNLANSTNTTNFSNVYNIYLYRLSGAFSQYISAEIYSCKIYDGVTLVRDYVPVMRKSDNVMGLYDRVSGQFYTNQGSGSFNVPYSLQGTGTQADPYQISSAMDLAYLSYQSQSNTFQNKYFLQTQDIELNDGWFEDDGTYHDGVDGKLYEWTPIGSSQYYFHGIYDGGSHKISGMYINGSGDCKGLIGYGKGTINNLTIDKAYICVDGSSVGGFVGTQGNQGVVTINNCIFDGIVTATGNYVAGFVGTGNVTYDGVDMTDCINKGKISGNSFVAGFAGRCSYARLMIFDSINTGKISGTGNVAGFVGGGDGSDHYGGDMKGTYQKITRCTNTGKISATTGGAYGVGNYWLTYTECENQGEITSTSGSVYGVATGTANYCKNFGKLNGKNVYGVTSASANNCENRGEIVATGTAYGVGGNRSYKLTYCNNYANITCSSGCGVGVGTMENCVNHGNITANGDAGGISLQESSGNNCINYGNVTTNSGYAGGMIAQKSEAYFDCHNYGSITTKTGYGAGGLIGWTYGSAQLTNCSNRGYVAGAKAGGVVGLMAYGGTDSMMNCVNYGTIVGTSSAGGLIGEDQYGNGNHSFYNCSNYGMCKAPVVGGIFGNSVNAHRITINQFANYGKLVGNTQMGIIGNGGGNKMTLDNVLISCEVTGKINDLPASVNKKNVIVDCKNENSFVKKYYGSDFSAFFMKYKTGYIGLKSLESAGVYMFTSPTPEYLERIGFTKVG